MQMQILKSIIIEMTVTYSEQVNDQKTMLI